MLDAGAPLPPTLVTMAKAAPKTTVADLAPLSGRPSVRVVETEGALRSFVECPEEAARLALEFLGEEQGRPAAVERSGKGWFFGLW